MPKNKDILWNAERLAQFSNLAGATEVEQFRASNQDFFPRDYQYWNNEGWPVELGTPPAGLEPFWQGFQRALQTAWQEGFPLEDCVRLIASATHEPTFGHDLLSYRVRPFQRAVMLLGVESWRARFCPICGKRFVADKPARRFCSTECAGKARRGTRAESWKRHGKRWRAKYETKKAARRRGRGKKR